MAGRRWLTGLVAAALMPSAALASGAPRRQTIEPPGLGVSFVLPSDWGPDLPPDAGWLWQGMAPGYVARLWITTVRSSLPFSRVGPNLAAVLRRQAIAADARAVVTARSIRVASGPAVEVVTKVHSSGLNGRTVLVDYTYGFKHGGRLYIFDYHTTAAWLAKEKPAFAESIASVRFPNVA